MRVWVLKKKNAPANRYGLTNSVKNIAIFDHLFIYLFIFNISFGEFGYWKKKMRVWVLKKKKKHQLTGMDSQIVWKILSDGNWVMMLNRCEKLSDEWWKLSDEWWVDGNWVIKKVKPNCPLLVWDGLWPECALTWY